MSLVCRRLYGLVTTPHAWRMAFSRYFPGPDVLMSTTRASNSHLSGQEEHLRLEQRLFTRLTALASWRSEYITRTRLLRSLTRGKPSQIPPGHGASTRTNSAANNAKALVTYTSQLFSSVNHLDAVWLSDRKSPRFVHGTDETGSASSSDPNNGKVDNWGLTDRNSIPQFTDIFVGDSLYGLGDGPAGLPSVMAVSQLFGMVYGGGYPGGSAYFRSTDELRGRALDPDFDGSRPELGIPNIPSSSEGISSVWIAQSNSIPGMTSGLVGLMTGSTLGVVTAYSLGPNKSHLHRLGRGQVTARWVISPGIPVIGLRLDESYNASRKACRRIWAVALNALGEVYYLTDSFKSECLKNASNSTDRGKEAWATGRTIEWKLVETSCRAARDDPYQSAGEPGRYAPHSSSNNMHLSREQVVTETREIDRFLKYQPAHFRKVCEGWDMRRRLEVDFGGDDMHGAGESIVVVKCGFEEEDSAEVRRFLRLRQPNMDSHEYNPSRMATKYSPIMASPTSSLSPPQSPSICDQELSGSVEEWWSSLFSLKGYLNTKITASSIDTSKYALTTIGEDPLHTANGVSVGFETLRSQSFTPSAQVPGHRARYLALGTDNGTVIMYNMRGPHSKHPALINELQPLRIIRTDSPEISCLAVSALCVVHGGSDGLVQAWDVIASVDAQPLRTINSRFSSRARRRLIQAEASVHGVGVNLYAAGAILLDPDPTVLRGMVSLGNTLHYWSYSSSLVDQYRNKKRRLRRSAQRGSNSGSNRFASTGNIKDYIASEQEELEEDNARRAKDEARFQRRFGVGLGGLSDDEALRYAELVSAETFRNEEVRRVSDAGYLADASPASSTSVWSSGGTITPENMSRHSTAPSYAENDTFEHDLEEAIRRSLLDEAE